MDLPLVNVLCVHSDVPAVLVQQPNEDLELERRAPERART